MQKFVVISADPTEKSAVFQSNTIIMPTKEQVQGLMLMTKQEDPASIRMAVGMQTSPGFRFYYFNSQAGRACQQKAQIHLHTTQHEIIFPLYR